MIGTGLDIWVIFSMMFVFLIIILSIVIMRENRGDD